MPTTDPLPGANERRWHVLDMAVALPGTVLCALTLVLLAMAPFGLDVLWPTEPLTLSEAAALRDDADVLILTGRGVDPNTPDTIRPGLLTRDEHFVTPLEAAVLGKREETVELLLRLGATVDTRTWTRLMCFAELLDAPDVRDVLEDWRPAGVVLDCTGVSLPFEP